MGLRASPTAAIISQTNYGVPLFLSQIIAQLEKTAPGSSQIHLGAGKHGRDLFLEGLTVSQVVHEYGDVCQAVTELAGELDAPFSPEEFGTLNRCLDDAIAGAVTEFAHQELTASTGRPASQITELENLVFTAIAAMEALQSGSVGISGATGRLLARSLLTMRLVLSTDKAR
ncbi:MAG: hypothetical protein ABIX28_12420 [Vicinamibacterales bacterium]